MSWTYIYMHQIGATGQSRTMDGDKRLEIGWGVSILYVSKFASILFHESS